MTTTEQAKQYARKLRRYWGVGVGDAIGLADTIDALVAENERLREALEDAERRVTNRAIATACIDRAALGEKA